MLKLEKNNAQKEKMMKANPYNEDLVYVRQILEVAAVKMAAERRTQTDLSAIKTAQKAFVDQTLNVASGVEENLLFHLKIVAASKNDVLISLFMKIVPDLMDMFNGTKEQDDAKYFKAIGEHDTIIEHISEQNSEEAEAAMKLHLEHESSVV